MAGRWRPPITAADVQRHRDYIQRLVTAKPITVEYSYVSGPILVRVSKSLDPDEAQPYEAALASP